MISTNSPTFGARFKFDESITSEARSDLKVMLQNQGFYTKAPEVPLWDQFCRVKDSTNNEEIPVEFKLEDDKVTAKVDGNWQFDKLDSLEYSKQLHNSYRRVVAAGMQDLIKQIVEKLG